MKKSYLKLAGGIGVLAMASLIAGSPALAETKVDTSASSSNTQEAAQPSQVSQVTEVINNNAGEVAQNVTSVSQLSDVKPTDWAFTALQSLVERYGCIAGYPDKTYRGQRAMTRYEFAAGLNACLDKINEIITAGLADKVSKEDFAAVQKLQEEFAAELAALKGRVDTLEAKTATLEAQQFSTTTKLTGQAIFSVTGASGGNNGNVNTTLNSRVRLDFNTSFTGDDLLITRLQAGNGGLTAGNVIGIAPAGDLGNIGFDTFALDHGGVSNNFGLQKLVYEFKPFKDLKVAVGPAINVWDYVDVNSFANNEAVDFTSTFFLNNPLVVLINPINGVPGAALDWNPGKGALSIRAVYAAANGSVPSAGDNGTGAITNRGLFGDPYQGTIEVEFSPKDGDKKGPFALRLQYTKGSISNVDIESGGVNVEWAFAKGAALFGRYGFGTINSRGVSLSASSAYGNFVNPGTGNSISPQTWMFGLAFTDLFKPGALAGIAVGQPFISSQVGNSSQTNLEMFYNFPISSNISITPDLQFIFNPNNNSTNGTVTVGTVRTVFSF
jgi:Carbohydrate-selective porin, OprB family/S-layer homology domain